MSLFKVTLLELKKKIDSRSAYKEVITQSIQEVTNISLTPDAVVSLKDGVLSLRVTPTAKMAVVLKQNEIITSLQKKGVMISVIRLG